VRLSSAARAAAFYWFYLDLQRLHGIILLQTLPDLLDFNISVRPLSGGQTDESTYDCGFTFVYLKVLLSNCRNF